MADYPEPLLVESLRLPHQQNFIILHGRGSTSEKFGPPLLETPIPLNHGSSSKGSLKRETTLRECFPHARFVFLTAPWRRATIYKRALTHQWFNNWKLDPPATEREDLQVPGLRETTQYLHGLLRQEIAAVPGGASNVILGGLSQGCAASLTSVLLWQGEPLAAWFGMCGWLPFAPSLLENVKSGQGGMENDEVSSQSGEAEFDPFERSPGGNGEEPADAAISCLRGELELEQNEAQKSTQVGIESIKKIPVFFGHGVEDDRVSVVLGRAAHQCVDALGFDATWKEYEGLEHWYSGDMLSDLVCFISKRPGWVTEDYACVQLAAKGEE